jgi:hypothetical protein
VCVTTCVHLKHSIGASRSKVRPAPGPDAWDRGRAINAGGEREGTQDPQRHGLP